MDVQWRVSDVSSLGEKELLRLEGQQLQEKKDSLALVAKGQYSWARS